MQEDASAGTESDAPALAALSRLAMILTEIAESHPAALHGSDGIPVEDQGDHAGTCSKARSGATAQASSEVDPDSPRLEGAQTDSTDRFILRPSNTLDGSTSPASR